MLQQASFVPFCDVFVTYIKLESPLYLVLIYSWILTVIMKPVMCRSRLGFL